MSLGQNGLISLLCGLHLSSLFCARDDDFLSKVVPKLTSFYFNCLLPALAAEASSEIRVS